MFWKNSILPISPRRPMGMPLVKCDWTSSTKYSPLGSFSSYAPWSVASSSPTSQTLPQTLLEARKQAARPMGVAMNLRRSMPSLRDFSAAIWPVQYSTSFCFWVCGRGMYSSLETSCVGTGESTPFWWSRCPFRIHMDCSPLSDSLECAQRIIRLGEGGGQFGWRRQRRLVVRGWAELGGIGHGRVTVRFLNRRNQFRGSDLL